MARRNKIASAPPQELPIPVKVIRVDPSNLSGKSAKTVCKCDDSNLYVMKDVKMHRYAPHSEWFCTHLADAVGIPSIPCKILEMPANASGVIEKVFGSRFHPGEITHFTSNQPYWFLRVANGEFSISEIATVLSWIYAFDHFINNIDRHATNFFVSFTQNDLSILSLDYDKAWLCIGFPLPPMPFNTANPEHKTVIWQRQATALWGPWIKNDQIKNILDRIKKVSKKRIADILQSHPNEWLPLSDKNAILAWWKSDKFLRRIKEIEDGITSGSTDYV